MKQEPNKQIKQWKQTLDVQHKLQLHTNSAQQQNERVNAKKKVCTITNYFKTLCLLPLKHNNNNNCL